MKKVSALSMVAVLALGFGVAQAAAITVPNSGFDDQLGPDGTVAYSADDWVCAGQNSLWVRNTVDGEFVSSTHPNTLATAGGNGFNCLLQTLSQGQSCTATTENSVGVAVDGTTYTLTAAAGNTGYMSNQPDYTVSILVDGAAIASNTLDGDTIPNTYFSDVSVSYTATAGDAGKDIGILLTATSPDGSAWTCWDNVRLSSEVPEPTTLALLAVGGTMLKLRRKR